MDKQNLFSIGDVAKMFHLSVSSLRHYEDVGLITPEYIDPDSGYRYYGARQFEVLNSIRYLRALDMPLSEIADFLRNRDVERIEEKLLSQKKWSRLRWMNYNVLNVKLTIDCEPLLMQRTQYLTQLV